MTQIAQLRKEILDLRDPRHLRLIAHSNSIVINCAKSLTTIADHADKKYLFLICVICG